MIKWILLDQAGVQTKPVFSNKNIFELNKRKFSAVDLEKIFSSREYSDFMIGKLTEKKIVSMFVKKNNIGLTYEEYVFLFKQGIEKIEGMEEILDSLHKRFKLAAVINESKDWADYKFEISKFRAFFDKIFISGEIGLKKPNSEFFRHVLKNIKALPEECVFIDDQERNCLSAKKEGIRSIVFINPKQLKKDLAKLGIEV